MKGQGLKTKERERERERGSQASHCPSLWRPHQRRKVRMIFPYHGGLPKRRPSTSPASRASANTFQGTKKTARKKKRKVRMKKRRNFRMKKILKRLLTQKKGGMTKRQRKRNSERRRHQRRKFEKAGRVKNLHPSAQRGQRL